MISSGFSMHWKSVRERARFLELPKEKGSVKEWFLHYVPYVFQMAIPWEKHYHVLTDPLEHQ